jgi:hypothetical protein
MPIKHLKNSMLELARRKYVDMPKREKPRLPTDSHGHPQDPNGNPQFNRGDHYPGMAPIPEENPLNALIYMHEYDEQSAEKYEVKFLPLKIKTFEVVKVNGTGKKQSRVMGIDGTRVYNNNTSGKGGGGGFLGGFKNILGGHRSTMNPQRMIVDIAEWKLISAKEVLLKFKKKDGKLDARSYIGDEAPKIYAKINF